MSLRVHALTPEDLTAQKDRLYATILLNEGVVDVAGGSFVCAEDTGSNLSIRVGSGLVGDKAVVEGDSTADQGNYVVLSADATATVTLSAGDNSDPRIDRVGILVQDDEADSSGQSEAILTVVEGTPSSSPDPEPEPDNFLTLALVEVAAQASAVTNSDIEDTRVEAGLRDALLGSLLGVESYTPTFTATTTDPSVGNGQIIGRFRRIGDVVEFWIWLQFGTSGVTQGSGTYNLSLPVPADTTVHSASGSAGRGSSIGSGHFRDDSAVAQSEQLAVMLTTSTTVRMMAVSSTAIGSGSPMGWQVSDNISIHGFYVAAV